MAPKISIITKKVITLKIKSKNSKRAFSKITLMKINKEINF